VAKPHSCLDVGKEGLPVRMIARELRPVAVLDLVVCWEAMHHDDRRYRRKIYRVS
jgi:hypothetical protein